MRAEMSVESARGSPRHAADLRRPGQPPWCNSPPACPRAACWAAGLARSQPTAGRAQTAWRTRSRATRREQWLRPLPAHSRQHSRTVSTGSQRGVLGCGHAQAAAEWAGGSIFFSKKAAAANRHRRRGGGGEGVRRPVGRRRPRRTGLRPLGPPAISVAHRYMRTELPKMHSRLDWRESCAAAARSRDSLAARTAIWVPPTIGRSSTDCGDTEPQ